MGKKTKKNVRVVKFSTKKIRRFLSFVFFVVIAGSFFFNCLFFSKYQTIRNTVKDEQTAITEYLTDAKSETNLTSQAVSIYAEDFLKDYLTIPEKEEQRDRRKMELDSYFISSFAFSDDVITGWKGMQTVDEVEVIEVKKESKNLAYVSCRATYTTKNMANPKRVLTETTTADYVIPITTNQHGYAVMDYPAVVSTNLKAEMDADAITLEGEMVPDKVRTEITTFLDDFFVSYGISDEKLELMTEEKGLRGQNVHRIEVKQLVQTDDKMYQMQVTVDYIDEVTAVPSHVNYQLSLRRDSANNYFVTDIH